MRKSDLKKLTTRGKIVAVKDHYNFLSAIGVAKFLGIPEPTVRQYWPKLVKECEKKAGVTARKQD